MTATMILMVVTTMLVTMMIMMLIRLMLQMMIMVIMIIMLLLPRSMNEYMLCSSVPQKANAASTLRSTIDNLEALVPTDARKLERVASGPPPN